MPDRVRSRLRQLTDACMREAKVTCGIIKKFPSTCLLPLLVLVVLVGLEVAGIRSLTNRFVITRKVRTQSLAGSIASSIQLEVRVAVKPMYSTAALVHRVPQYQQFVKMIVPFLNETLEKDLVTKLQALEVEKRLKAEKKRKLDMLDKASKSSTEIFSASASTQSTIPDRFSAINKAVVDAAATKFFVANGIPFNVSRNRYFVEFVQKVAQIGPGYVPPKYEKLRTDWLNDCVQEVKTQTDEYLSTAKTLGCTLTSDGWSNTQNRPLLNILCITATGDVFCSAVDTSGATKDAQYIAEKLCEQIELIGPANIVHVVTDNAANCKAAGDIITQKYPNVTWTPCTAHCLDLFLEDLDKMDFVHERVIEAKKVVSFITNHHMSLAIFRQHSPNLGLLKPADTRFAYTFIVMQRLIKVKDALDKTVVSDEWKAWAAKPRVRDAAEDVREIVLKAAFWRSLQQIVDLTEPVIKLLRMCDGNTPCVGKVYNKCSEIEQHIANSDLSQRVKQRVATAWTDRWEMLHSPMHAAGYALDPQFQTHDFDAVNEEVMGGLMDMVERLVPNEAEQAEVMQQHADYRQQLGVFGRPMVKKAAETMPAYKWWLQFGSGAPLLQKVAVKVLSQVTSACACERNWSTFDFVHNKRRNKLKASRAADLVYAFSNLRLIDKTTAVDYEERVPEWGEDSDPQSEDEGEGEEMELA